MEEVPGTDTPETNAPKFDLGLPLETIFDSRETLTSSLQAWAISRGFTVSIGNGGCKGTRIRYKCSLGGTLKTRRQPQESSGAPKLRRNRTSRLTNCPFLLTAKHHKSDDKWYVNPTTPYHNHEGLVEEDMAALPQARRFTEEQKDEIARLAAEGCKPREILAALREDGGTTLATSKDISNEIAKQRQAMQRDAANATNKRKRGEMTADEQEALERCQSLLLSKLAYELSEFQAEQAANPGKKPSLCTGCERLTFHYRAQCPKLRRVIANKPTNRR
ncbi:methylmalonate-semialdehyde dehydrogenase [Drechslerella dactyloides]|uniref:Methylmalonate-semialdehyde dehydrogenase n=1 Tax=Drechslerella dactyloides TaxID=74499 RepID=A0AAD6NL92_DREDA|nr:methylmalonate-semialdehyde dehydrogenase [Drechslerella dactyloides]